MTRTFTKPALTWQQQIEHLRASGMHIDDEERAEYWLRRKRGVKAALHDGVGIG
ncbi:hypothetical protein [Croceicoccus naphthovorans]|uniref:hypothetical protein n=1 Tax=Croceicoccus naphthovorans TaxID=1348774 RepID=UPI000A5670FB|nr:hypothetical protein [Croceicoccus naphthovorans]MBB3991735.1 abortive infection bacteriophage resistance protein [Croceicoccus naphthovorans]